MGVGNYLGIRSQESALAARGLPEEESSPIRHGIATFLAFVVAGTVPLLPYVLSPASGLGVSATCTFAALFAVGAMRSAVTIDRWWIAGLEMLVLGMLVAGTAYGAGALVNAIVQ